MKERGSALLTAVIMVMILLSISGILLTTVIDQAKNESSEEKGLRAYYLAEAGIQYGIATGIEAVSASSEAEFRLSPSPVNDPFGQGGTFKVTVTKEVEATSFTVTSTGDYLGARRMKKAEYEFGEEVDDGNGDDGDIGDNNYCEDDVILPNYPQWTARDYQANSYVIYNGKAFYSRNYANSTQIPGVPPNSHWQQITKKWTEFNSYRQGDIVCMDGNKYKARYNMTGSIGKVPGVVESNNHWQELTNQWRNFNSYSQGDIVFYGGKLFQARNNMISPQVGKVPGVVESNNHWQELTDQWRDFNSYSQGDVVFYGGKLFQARNNMMYPQVGKVPGGVESNNHWQELTDEWRSFNYYYPNNTVLYNGQWYKAKWTSSPPGTVPGGGGVWEKIYSTPAETLVTILVTPINPLSIQVGQTQTFMARAVYSNGSTTDVSNAATWLSSNTSIATLAPGGIATARATGVVNGTYPIPISPATPASISIPISIPITAAFEGKLGTAYLTISASSNNTPPTIPGTNTGKILWEKEVIE